MALGLSTFSVCPFRQFLHKILMTHKAQVAPSSCCLHQFSLQLSLQVSSVHLIMSSQRIAKGNDAKIYIAAN